VKVSVQKNEETFCGDSQLQNFRDANLLLISLENNAVNGYEGGTTLKSVCYEAYKDPLI
jgi:hypothetical protein